ncbi:MAG: class I SAM-dependent methyltransferase [Fimbriimonadales bacterium]
MHESQARWNVAADLYRTSSWHSNEAALAHLVEVAAARGGRALDIATGAGHAALAIAPFVDAMVATDTAPRMLEVTMQEAERRGLSNLTAEYADALDLPFENNSFDLAICRTAAHHFSDPVRFLGETYRVLKPDAKLILVDTTGSDDESADDLIDTFERKRDPSHVRNYTKPAWRRMADRAGFTVESEETVSKPLNAKEWLERQEVLLDTRVELIDMITLSQDWFREYLSPHGEGELLTFHLDETTFAMRKKR